MLFFFSSLSLLFFPGKGCSLVLLEFMCGIDIVQILIQAEKDGGEGIA